MEIDWDYHRSEAFVRVAIDSTNPTVSSALEALKVAVNIVHPDKLDNHLTFMQEYIDLMGTGVWHDYHKTIYDLVDMAMETGHPDAMAALDNFYDIANGIRTKA